jgi:hypothetical protein
MMISRPVRYVFNALVAAARLYSPLPPGPTAIADHQLESPARVPRLCAPVGAPTGAQRTHMSLHYTPTAATAPQHQRANMRSPSTSSGMRPRVSPAARRVVATMLVVAIVR